MKKVSAPGQGAGLSGTVTFMPGKGAAASGQIRMIQVVRMTAGGADFSWRGTSEAARNQIRTGAGYFVGILTVLAKDKGYSPYYSDYNGDPANRSGFNNGNGVGPAVIADAPFIFFNGSFRAETVAVNVDTGQFYGSVTWGFDSMNDVPTPIAPTASDVPSQAFNDALAQFRSFYSK